MDKTGDKKAISQEDILSDPRFWRYLASLPEHRLAIVAETDLTTGETQGVIVKQTGNEPPVSKRLRDNEIGKENDRC